MKIFGVNIRKFFIFPWGIITSLVGYVPLAVGILSFADLGKAETPIFIIGICLIILVVMATNFWYPRPKKKGYNVFIMLSPVDDQDLDKFISIDIAELLIGESNDKINFYTPNVFQRYTFYWLRKLYSQKQKDFSKSKWYAFFLWRTRTHATLVGSIKKRSNGEEVYVINIEALYQHQFENEDLSRLVEATVEETLLKQQLISINDEVNGIKRVAEHFKDISTFIIGLSELSAGHFGTAFKIHYPLLKRKGSNIKFSYRSLEAILLLEIFVLYRLYLVERDYQNAIQYVKAFKDIKPRDALYSETQLMMCMTSSEIEMKETVKKCNSLLYNEPDKPVALSSKAYLALIKGSYKKSENFYKKFFKQVREDEKTGNIVESLRIYIEIAKEKPFERAYALFLLGQISFFYDKDYGKAKNCFDEVRTLVPREHYLFGKCTKFIQEISVKLEKGA